MSLPVVHEAPVAPPPAPAGGGVRVSPAARRALRALTASRGRTGEAVWIRPDSAGGFDLALVDRGDVAGDDWIVLDSDPLPVAWSRSTSPALRGALVDHEAGGFRVRLAPKDDAALADEVRRVLEDGVNPLVASHGGRVRLAEVRDGRVRVRMDGGCQGCASARETLVGVVVRRLESAVPGIRSVEDVTDHAAGGNPWFRPGRRTGTPLPVVDVEALREACG